MFTPAPSEHGGAQRRAALLASAFADRGWEVRLLGRAAARAPLRVARRRRTTIVEAPAVRSPRLSAVLYLLVAVPLGALWGRPADLLLSLQLSSTTTAAAIAGTLSRTPVVALASTSGILSESDLVRSGRRRMPLRSVGWFVAQSPAAMAELSAIVGSDRVAIVPNPVASGMAVPPLPVTRSVMFAGRFSAEKDLACLLEAWRAVIGGVPDARLVLAGEAPLHRSVAQEISETLANDPALAATVALPGWLDDLHGALARVRVFVLPSLSEGMSNALLEACAAGRVVVASDIPANRAVLGDDYPLLFPAGDASALAAALRAALVSPAIGTAAVAAIASRMERFHPQTVVDQILHLSERARRPRHQ